MPIWLADLRTSLVPNKLLQIVRLYSPSVLQPPGDPATPPTRPCPFPPPPSRHAHRAHASLSFSPCPHPAPRRQRATRSAVKARHASFPPRDRIDDSARTRGTLPRPDPSSNGAPRLSLCFALSRTMDRRFNFVYSTGITLFYEDNVGDGKKSCGIVVGEREYIVPLSRWSSRRATRFCCWLDIHTRDCIWDYPFEITNQICIPLAGLLSVNFSVI